jgi:asparagine synthetase B (glutamine-hydrolysing)
MKIILSKLPWYHDNNISVTGFVRKGERYLRGRDLLSFFSDCDTDVKFEQKLVTANGQFSVIVKKPDEIWAATDRFRNYPLFYTRTNGEFVLSDDCYKLADQLHNRSLNPQAIDSFLSSGYTLNNLTLVNDIFQVEAGEFIKEGSKFSRKFYFDLASCPVINKKFDVAAEELNHLFSLVFESHFK